MLLGIVSDTHGHIHNTLAAVRMLKSLPVEQVLHCGDIGSAEIPSLFAPWPTHYVLGNVDRDEAALQRAIEQAGHHFYGRFGAIELEGIRVALIHSDDARAFRQTIQSGDWDLVCYGHTHKAESHREGRTLVLNPGALYRAQPHSLAVVELPALTVTPVAF